MREGTAISSSLKMPISSDLCVLLGFPPKIIWIRRGNCSTTALDELLRQHCDDIEGLETDAMNGVLTLF